MTDDDIRIREYEAGAHYDQMTRLELMSDYLSFGMMREFIYPLPECGRINKVLRAHFFRKNEKGHWIPVGDCRRYLMFSPSQPRWHPTVIPLAAELLTARYGKPYAPTQELLDHLEKNKDDYRKRPLYGASAPQYRGEA